MLILPCGTCPNLNPFADIAPYYRNTGTPSRTYILLAQGLQIGFISLIVVARTVGLKKTMRPRGKECCDLSIMSAMDLGKRVASCLLCICQLGPNATRQESNLIKLLKIFCICKSAMALTRHHASFATKVTCYSTPDLHWGRTRRQWHSLRTSWKSWNMFLMRKHEIGKNVQWGFQCLVGSSLSDLSLISF